MYLNNEESMLVVGGAIKATLGVIIYGIVTFITGFVAGFFSTRACRLR